MVTRAELEAEMNAPLRGLRRYSKQTKLRGYAAAPGTGPENETCGSCRHLFRNRLAKTYLKCDLMKAWWTGGPGTDIRARSPACKFWEA